MNFATFKFHGHTVLSDISKKFKWTAEFALYDNLGTQICVRRTMTMRDTIDSAIKDAIFDATELAAVFTKAANGPIEFRYEVGF